MRRSSTAASASRSARSARSGSALSRECRGSCRMDEVLGEIRRVLRDELQLAREPRPEDDLVQDLQLDSVGLLTLVVGLEDRFRIALTEEDASRVRTVAELANLVAQRAGGN